MFFCNTEISVIKKSFSCFSSPYFNPSNRHIQNNELIQISMLDGVCRATKVKIFCGTANERLDISSVLWSKYISTYERKKKQFYMFLVAAQPYMILTLNIFNKTLSVILRKKYGCMKIGRHSVLLYGTYDKGYTCLSPDILTW